MLSRLFAVTLLVTVGTPAAGQTPTKVGPVLTVSGAYANYPKVAVGDDGDFMIVWWDDPGGADDIRGRIYDQAGTPQASDFVIQDSGYYASQAFNHFDGIQDVAADGASDFVVVFNAEPPTYLPCADGPCVFSRRVADSGVLGTQFLIENTGYPVFQAGNPEVAQNGTGQFIVAWEAVHSESYYSGVDDEDVFAATLNSDGSAFSTKFQANEIYYGYQSDGGFLDVAGGPSGDFVIAWDNEYYATGLRRVSAGGTPLGPESSAFPLSMSPYDPQVAYEAGGNFMVVAFDSYADSLSARVFDPAGTALGSAFTISTSVDDSYPQPAVAGFPDDHFVVVWFEGTKVLGQRIDRLGNLTGSSFEVTGETWSAPEPDVDTDLDGNFTVVWEDYYVVFGQRFASPDQDFPLVGKKVKIKNKVPDDPEKNKARWVVKDPALDLPLPGSSADPTCNGDPAGTVKASIRFWSDDSGHDTGVIDLPCQWWVTFGSGSKLSYQYKDLKLFDSPCKFIKLKQGSQIRATCLGRNPLFPLDYDLEVGTAEGAVHTTLTLGFREYCTSIPTFKKDGSDGKTFLGKDGPAPTSCP